MTAISICPVCKDGEEGDGRCQACGTMSMVLHLTSGKALEVHGDNVIASVRRALFSFWGVPNPDAAKAAERVAGGDVSAMVDMAQYSAAPDEPPMAVSMATEDDREVVIPLFSIEYIEMLP